MERTDPAARNREIRRIHAMARELRLADDDYRNTLRTVTGQDSCSKLDWTQRKCVIEHLEKLRQAHGLPSRAKPKTTRSNTADDPLTRKVLACWHALHNAGVLLAAGERSLDSWVERQCKVSALRFCTPVQKGRLVDALKSWATRSGLVIDSKGYIRPQAPVKGGA
jgi:phage gp16-like protein